MGKIIKNLAEADLKDNPIKKIELELNVPNIVHVQNEAWRIEMTTDEFRGWAKQVVKAAAALRKLKNG